MKLKNFLQMTKTFFVKVRGLESSKRLLRILVLIRFFNSSEYFL